MWRSSRLHLRASFVPFFLSLCYSLATSLRKRIFIIANMWICHAATLVDNVMKHLTYAV